MDIKLSIFKEIDQFAPENCILSTNTSSISITKIAAVTKEPIGYRNALHESSTCNEIGRSNKRILHPMKHLKP